MIYKRVITSSADQDQYAASDQDLQCLHSIQDLLYNNNNDNAPSEYSDQTAHLRSLIRIFAGRILESH